MNTHRNQQILELIETNNKCGYFNILVKLKEKTMSRNFYVKQKNISLRPYSLTYIASHSRPFNNMVFFTLGVHNWKLSNNVVDHVSLFVHSQCPGVIIGSRVHNWWQVRHVWSTCRLCSLHTWTKSNKWPLSREINTANRLPKWVNIGTLECKGHN